MRKPLLMLASAATLLLALGWTQKAAACHTEEGIARTTACFTSIHVAVASSVFGPADIYYASQRRWLPPTWAWTQLMLGSIATLGGGATAIGLAVHDSPEPELDIAWASGAMLLGSFYGSVAVFSLQRYRLPSAAEPPPSPTAGSWLRMPAISVLPTDGGAMVMASF